MPVQPILHYRLFISAGTLLIPLFKQGQPCELRNEGNTLCIITYMDSASERKSPCVNGSHDKDLEPQEKQAKVGPQKTALVIKVVPVLILLVVSFAVYFNALSGNFVYDDEMQIVKNPWIRDVSNVPTIFSKSVWSFVTEKDAFNYYRPLMHIVYMLDYYLFGLNPWGFHLVNILFHCGVTVLVFLVIRKFLGEQGVTKSSLYLSPAFIAALFFATHPVHTEAVAWIAGLPDLAFTFFYLLSFYFYIRSKTVLSGSCLFSVVCFAVAALFKEPALTLPVILFAYDFICREEHPRLTDCVKRYMPYLAIATAYLAMRIHVLGAFAPVKRHAILTAYQYVINIFPLFARYLEKLLLPVNLNAYYVFHPISSLFQWKGIISLIVALVFIVLLIIAFKKNRVAFLGLLFVTVPLLPVLYIPALGENTFADRYLYLPSVGYVLILAIFLSSAKKKLPRAANIFAVAMILVAGVYSAGTITRNNVWKDNSSLWSDTVKKSPDSETVHYNLARAYRSRGKVGEAIAEYKRALWLNPFFAKAHFHLGNAYASQGRMSEAIPEYREALLIQPDYAEAHTALGVAYGSLGQIGKAIEEFQAALQLKPDYAIAHYNLGNAYEYQGQLDKAIEEFETALRLKPDNYKARQRLDALVSKRR
jgi:tetratricopeptide (TPR) repeat protein